MSQLLLEGCTIGVEISIHQSVKQFTLMCSVLDNIISRWEQRTNIVTGGRRVNITLQVEYSRVKSGKFGQSAKFGERPCLFHILIIGIKIN